MKISINWINDYVDLEGIVIPELLNKFTLSVAEIEGYELKGRDISGIVTGKILSVSEVVNSKKLHALKVDTKDEILDIICGAPNVRVGMIVPVAKIGAKLGDITIGKAKLAGLDSFGMCCGGDEIGVSDDHGGLLELPSLTPIGVDIKTVLPIEDIIFEVDNKALTNRPDLWGHYGIAREIAALTGRKLKPLKLYNEELTTKGPNVTVASKDCFRYSSIVIDSISKNESSLEMQTRLYYCGMRAINFLADLTNYIMLELGQPMHAFDGGIVNQIEVENLFRDEKFITLDNVERELKKGTLVIKSNGNISAVAGVMGGLDSEIVKGTTKVLVESACFDGAVVRKAASSIGLRTDSSARYEKMLDPTLTMTALKRFIYMVLEYDKSAKIFGGITDIYLYKYPTIKIDITKSFVDKYIGKSLPLGQIIDTLESLEFKVEKIDDDSLKVIVPSFRATKDVSNKADLVEEITRIYGYDNIEATPIYQPVEPHKLNNEVFKEYKIKYDLATKFALNEVHTYLWYDFAFNNEIGINPPSYIKILNSLNKENNQIRSTLIPSLLKVISSNKISDNNVGVFEIGRAVEKVENNLAVETKKLCIALYEKSGDQASQIKKLCDIVSYILSYSLNLDFEIKKCDKVNNILAPVNNYEFIVNNKVIGQIGIISPIFKHKIDENCSISVAEIDISELVKTDEQPVKFKSLSKFPTTKLDFNFLVTDNKNYSDLIKIFNDAEYDSDINCEISLLDIFKLENGVSYTLHFEISSMTKNLTSADIEKFHSSVIEVYKKNKVELKN